MLDKISGFITIFTCSCPMCGKTYHVIFHPYHKVKCKKCNFTGDMSSWDVEQDYTLQCNLEYDGFELTVVSTEEID